MNPVTRALRAPFEARTWRETFHLLFNLPVGIVTFTLIVTGLATGLGMLITLVGIPILFVTMYVSRWMASVERARAKVFLHVDVPAPYRADPEPDKWWRVHVARFTDPATWVEVGYHLLMLPVGIFTFTVAVVFWTLGLSLVTFPLYFWALPNDVILGDGLRIVTDQGTVTIGPVGVQASTRRSRWRSSSCWARSSSS